MNIIEKILLFLHLIGMAYLLGGLLTQIKIKSKTINRSIMNGFMLQLLTGPMLVLADTKVGAEILCVQPIPMNETILAVKALSILVMSVIIISSRKPQALSNIKYWSLLAMALTEVGLALFVD